MYKRQAKMYDLDAEEHSMYRYPSLRARVPRRVLEGGDNGPFRRGLLARVGRYLRPARPVKVERLPDGLGPTILYAPLCADDDQSYAPTSFVSGRPRADDPDLVYSDMPYEVRVAGMFAKSYDQFDNTNELVLYSVQTDPNNDAQSLPFIHFDYSRDSTCGSERPNTYLPIPASRSYVVGSAGKRSRTPGTGVVNSSVPVTPLNIESATHGKKGGKSRAKKSVNVQFRMLEIDDPSKTVSDAVAGIHDLGGMMAGMGSAVPFLGVLNPALAMVSTLSQRALDSYARPDKVVNIDMDFNIANRRRVADGTAPVGEYLKYGYYFFLAEPVEGKLYASVRTPGNLTLMLKRCDEPAAAKRQVQARTYFPLTEVSYLVVKVAEPTDTKRANRKPIQMNHAHMLEDLFKRARPGEDEPARVRDSLFNLGVELGVFDSDSEHELRY